MSTWSCWLDWRRFIKLSLFASWTVFSACLCFISMVNGAPFLSERWMWNKDVGLMILRAPGCWSSREGESQILPGGCGKGTDRDAQGHNLGKRRFQLGTRRMKTWSSCKVCLSVGMWDSFDNGLNILILPGATGWVGALQSSFPPGAFCDPNPLEVQIFYGIKESGGCRAGLLA